MKRKATVTHEGLMVRLRAQGWTYEAIGKHLGISRQAVHKALTTPQRQQGSQRDRERLAQRLKALRFRAGISRVSLAQQASLGHVTVWYIEKGLT